MPSKCCIQKLITKLETTGTLITQHAGGRKMNVDVVDEVKERLLSSPSKSLRQLSQGMNVPYSACQRADKKAKIHPYRVTCVQELQPTDNAKRMQFFVWFQNFINQNPGILDLTWFTDEAWFHLSGYINSQNTRIRAEKKSSYPTCRTPTCTENCSVVRSVT